MNRSIYLLLLLFSGLSYMWLCDLMDGSMSGFPVLHYLFTGCCGIRSSEWPSFPINVFYFFFFRDFFFIIYLFLFYFTILYWFCHTLTWIHHQCTWVPNPEPASHLPPHTISGSSQCTSSKHPVSCIEPRLAIHFLHDSILVSMPFSLIIPPSPSSTESKSLFYTSVSLLLSRIITIFLKSIYMC